MRVVLWSLVVCGAMLGGRTASAGDAAPFLAPWADGVAYPTPEEICFPKGIYHRIVHDCDTDPDYKFLHETAIGVLDGQLFAAWYHNPERELNGKTFQRFRTSQDFGKTWSGHAVLMDRGNDKGLMYVGVQFLTGGGTLYALTNQEHGAERPVDCILLSWDKDRRRWIEHGPVAERFLAMQQPMRMNNGNFVMSGSYAARPGQVNATVPVVYISQGEDIQKPWRRVLLDTAEHVNVFAETAVVVDGKNLLAVTRLEKKSLSELLRVERLRGVVAQDRQHDLCREQLQVRRRNADHGLPLYHLQSAPLPARRARHDSYRNDESRTAYAGHRGGLAGRKSVFAHLEDQRCDPIDRSAGIALSVCGRVSGHALRDVYGAAQAAQLRIHGPSRRVPGGRTFAEVDAARRFSTIGPVRSTIPFACRMAIP
jgi:hypothetical protein